MRSARAEAELWALQGQAAWDEARRELALRYEPLVKRIAADIYGRRSDVSLEYADFVQFGMVGLMEAVDRYRAGGEASFATYASYRIRGEILNGMAHASERVEQVACRQRLQRERLDDLKTAGKEAGRGDVFVELAEVAIGLAVSFMLEDSGLVQNDERPADPGEPYGTQEWLELRDRIEAVVQALPEREQTIIRGHYMELKNFDELAARLGVSKGRVSQLHRRALTLIRQALQQIGGLEGYY